jgi:hypothetical protein
MHRKIKEYPSVERHVGLQYVLARSPLPHVQCGQHIRGEYNCHTFYDVLPIQALTHVGGPAKGLEHSSFSVTYSADK